MSPNEGDQCDRSLFLPQKNSVFSSKDRSRVRVCLCWVCVVEFLFEPVIMPDIIDFFRQKPVIWPDLVDSLYFDGIFYIQDFDEYWKGLKIWAEISRVVDELYQPDLCTGARALQHDLDRTFRKCRPILYGEGCEESHRAVETISDFSAERYSLFKELRSAKELKGLTLKYKQILDYVITDSTTDGVRTPCKFFHFSFSESFRLSVRNAMYSQSWEVVESLILPIAFVALVRAAAIYSAIVVLAVQLVSMVFRYLIGPIDRGGGKEYSSGSLEFRSTYISIVLYHGSYIWIKFRDVAQESSKRPGEGLFRRIRENESGERVYYGNFEPRMKPPGSGTYIAVGTYENEKDADTVYKILAFWCGKDGYQG